MYLKKFLCINILAKMSRLKHKRLPDDSLMHSSFVVIKSIPTIECFSFAMHFYVYFNHHCDRNHDYRLLKLRFLPNILLFSFFHPLTEHEKI